MKTTLPKARDAARLAEKVCFCSSFFIIIIYPSNIFPLIGITKPQVITLGKKGTHPAWKKASSFLLHPHPTSLTPKLFETLATRYADRPGGYTRIHKFGRRPGDNAPHAVLELVDGPRDLKLEMTARATAWDVLSSRLKKSGSGSGSGSGSCSPRELVEMGVKDVEETIGRERALGESGVEGEGEGELRQRTRWNLRKALRYRSSEDVKRFGDKVQEHMVRLSP